MSNPKVVMCDTMIWYEISDGTERLDKIKYKYYGSESNIADFLSSDKMKYDEATKSKLKKAILTMNNIADDIIMVDPISAGSSAWFKIPIAEEEVRGIQGVYSELLKYANGEVSKIFGPTIDGLINSKENFRLGSISIKQQLEDLFKSK